MFREIKGSKGDTYFVSWFPCPACAGQIYMCTCADFQKGKPHRGVNPLINPCKHVRAIQQEQDNEARISRFIEEDPDNYLDIKKK